jgi:hypothetical protein
MIWRRDKKKALKQDYSNMVRWYIFDVRTFLISLTIKEFCSLRDAGTTFLTVVEWCGQLVELSVLISPTQQFVSQSCSLLLREAECCCLAICTITRLSRYYLVPEVISIAPPLSDITSWLSCVTVTSTSWRSFISVGCFFCSTSDTFRSNEKYLQNSSWH